MSAATMYLRLLAILAVVTQQIDCRHIDSPLLFKDDVHFNNQPLDHLPPKSLAGLGSWQGPFARATCKELEAPFKGSMACSHRRKQAGTTCSFSCDEGFQLTPPGRETLRCIGGSMKSIWHRTPPCCKPVKCTIRDKLDLLFIVDKSNSNSQREWQLQIDFIIEFLSRDLMIGPDNVRVGILPFARRPDHSGEIYLKDTTTKDNLFKQIRDISCCESGTFTGTAMKHAVDVSLTANNGDRPDTPNLAIVVTDGAATEGFINVVKGAAKLREAAATFAVGIGIKVGRGVQTIAEIAGSRNRNNQYFAKKQQELLDAVIEIQEKAFYAGCDICATKPVE